MKLYHLLILFLCCLASAGTAIAMDRIIGLEVVEDVVDARTTSILNAPSFTEAAQTVIPAVVYLKAFPATVSPFEPSLRHTTTGSGVIIDEKGLIVTNGHVIKDAVRLRVVTEDKREFNAEVIGIDQATDIALLRIDAGRTLPFIPFGDSDSLLIGEWVLAVGNPYSLNSTVTAGIVSGKGRSIDVLEPDDRIENFIQTDAAINPGNSGGALVNAQGELIGINTAILSVSGRDEGFAFAVPGNLVMRVVDDLIAYGEVRRAVIGAYVQSVNAAQAVALGMDKAKGVLITRVKPNSSASNAGLKKDDVILELNDASINSPAELQDQLSKFRPGDSVAVTFLSRGTRHTVTMELKNKRDTLKKLVSGRE